MTVSPLKSRNYRGDLALEAKFFKAITGEEMTQEKLDLAAERIFTLHRAYTVKLMQTKDMRNEHDLICSWVFDKDPQIPVFTEGTDKMDRDDMHASLTMFYKEMGWNHSLVVRPAKHCSVWGWKILPPIWQHTIYCLRKEWVR